MEVKITSSQAVYKNMMNSIANSEKTMHTSGRSDKKVQQDAHQDEIIISGDGLKKQDAAKAAEEVYKTMGQEAKADRISEIKRQVQDGTYSIPAEVIAGSILSGM